jgi:hypothetical protein
MLKVARVKLKNSGSVGFINSAGTPIGDIVWAEAGNFRYPTIEVLQYFPFFLLYMYIHIY